MRPILILALPALALSACSDSSEATRDVEMGAPEAPAPTAPPVLNDVALDQPLAVLGTEPFWSVRIRPDGIEYDGVDRPLRRGANPGPMVQGTTAVWATATEDGQTLVVTLAATPCSDGMSDRAYPLTAQVEVGAETLNGCAAPQSTIDTTDETGQPKAATS
ncbi:hypothetical protein [Brevundimonas lutea]|uniref:hypothetical protein n=1 Tax=Brevundimonas lutea TaxID=2293980 RepID=UPI000F036867|nr:hypothetical protein [Brevundimonas lutea]